MKKVLLGVTGSVATTLVSKIYQAIIVAGFEVKIVATEKSLFFWNEADVPGEVLFDKDEWISGHYMKNDLVPHIELREWADIFLVAPLSANTMAKMANGICDNLLTTIACAWPKNKPVIIAPAMNTMMWKNSITEANLDKLKERFDLHLVPPQAKLLACGEQGEGALADIQKIINEVKSCSSESKMKKKVIIVGGPVAQKIDPVLNLVPTGKGGLANEIAIQLENVFQVERVGNFPGGEVCDFFSLQKKIVDFSGDAVVFLPHLPNFIIEESQSKIRLSKNGTGELKIQQAPKLVAEIKKLHPNCLLVPFKLADGGMSVVEIVRWMLQLHAGLAVYSRIGKKDEYFIIDALANQIKTDRKNLPQLLSQEIERVLAVTRRGSKRVSGEVPEVSCLEDFVTFSRKMQPAFSQIIEKNVASGRWPGNFSFRCTHGFISGRCDGGFIITKRDVDKTGLTVNDFVWVDETLRDDHLAYSGIVGNKPSVDAPVHRIIYEKLAWVKAIVHGHLQVSGENVSEYQISLWPCGAENEAYEILEYAPLEKRSLWVINVPGHGFVALIGDSNLADALNMLSSIKFF